MIKAKKARIESLAIHIGPPFVCTYCKRNGHLEEQSNKKLMGEYRMLNDIHKRSYTRAEVRTSSSERDNEETDKSRFSEKEIGDQTGRPKLPGPDNLHKDYTKTIEPEQRWAGFMKDLLPPKPNIQTNRNCLIYLPPRSKDTNMYGTTATTPA